MKTRTCECYEHPDNLNRCGLPATHAVPGYFNRNARGKRGDRTLYLCAAHAAGRPYLRPIPMPERRRP